MMPSLEKEDFKELLEQENKEGKLSNLTERRYNRQEDLDYLAMKIAEDLKSKFTVPSEIHKSHHELISILIAEKEKRIALYCKVCEDVTRWGILGALSFLGFAVWEYFKHKVVGPTL